MVATQEAEDRYLLVLKMLAYYHGNSCTWLCTMRRGAAASAHAAIPGSKPRLDYPASLRPRAHTFIA